MAAEAAISCLLESLCMKICSNKRKGVSQEGEYEGETVASQRHGKGVYMDATGSWYEGHWQGDKRHGNGMQVWKKYRVEWPIFELDIAIGSLRKTEEGTKDSG